KAMIRQIQRQVPAHHPQADHADVALANHRVAAPLVKFGMRNSKFGIGSLGFRGGFGSWTPTPNSDWPHSLISMTFTAFTATRTLSPFLIPSSSSESSVMTDSIMAPPATFTLTWHMTVPRLTSVTSPSRRLRAPIFMALSLKGAILLPRL